MQLVNIIVQFCAKFQVVPVTGSQVFGAKSVRKNRVFRFFTFSCYHSVTNRQMALIFCMQLGINMIKRSVRFGTDQITKHTYYRQLKSTRNPAILHSLVVFFRILQNHLSYIISFYKTSVLTIRNRYMQLWEAQIIKNTNYRQLKTTEIQRKPLFFHFCFEITRVFTLHFGM